MDDVNLRSKLGQVDPFFNRSVPTPDDGNLLVFEKRAITNGTITYSPAGKLGLTGSSLFPEACPGGEKDRSGFD